jgi:hypothetical protein
VDKHHISAESDFLHENAGPTTIPSFQKYDFCVEIIARRTGVATARRALSYPAQSRHN